MLARMPGSRDQVFLGAEMLGDGKEQTILAVGTDYGQFKVGSEDRPQLSRQGIKASVES